MAKDLSVAPSSGTLSYRTNPQIIGAGLPGSYRQIPSWWPSQTGISMTPGQIAAASGATKISGASFGSSQDFSSQVNVSGASQADLDAAFYGGVSSNQIRDPRTGAIYNKGEAAGLKLREDYLRGVAAQQAAQKAAQARNLAVDLGVQGSQIYSTQPQAMAAPVSVPKPVPSKASLDSRAKALNEKATDIQRKQKNMAYPSPALNKQTTEYNRAVARYNEDKDIYEAQQTLKAVSNKPVKKVEAVSGLVVEEPGVPKGGIDVKASFVPEQSGYVSRWKAEQPEVPGAFGDMYSLERIEAERQKQLSIMIGTLSTGLIGMGAALALSAGGTTALLTYGAKTGAGFALGGILEETSPRFLETAFPGRSKETYELGGWGMGFAGFVAGSGATGRLLEGGRTPLVSTREYFAPTEKGAQRVLGIGEVKKGFVKKPFFYDVTVSKPGELKGFLGKTARSGGKKALPIGMLEEAQKPLTIAEKGVVFASGVKSSVPVVQKSGLGPRFFSGKAVSGVVAQKAGTEALNLGDISLISGKIKIGKPSFTSVFKDFSKGTAKPGKLEALMKAPAKPFEELQTVFFPGAPRAAAPKAAASKSFKKLGGEGKMLLPAKPSEPVLLELPTPERGLVVQKNFPAGEFFSSWDLGVKGVKAGKGSVAVLSSAPATRQGVGISFSGKESQGFVFLEAAKAGKVVTVGGTEFSKAAPRGTKFLSVARPFAKAETIKVSAQEVRKLLGVEIPLLGTPEAAGVFNYGKSPAMAATIEKLAVRKDAFGAFTPKGVQGFVAMRAAADFEVATTPPKAKPTVFFSPVKTVPGVAKTVPGVAKTVPGAALPGGSSSAGVTLTVEREVEKGSLGPGRMSGIKSRNIVFGSSNSLSQSGKSSYGEKPGDIAREKPPIIYDNISSGVGVVALQKPGKKPGFGLGEKTRPGFSQGEGSFESFGFGEKTKTGLRTATLSVQMPATASRVTELQKTIPRQAERIVTIPKTPGITIQKTPPIAPPIPPVIVNRIESSRAKERVVGSNLVPGYWSEVWSRKEGRWIRSANILSLGAAMGEGAEQIDLGVGRTFRVVKANKLVSETKGRYKIDFGKFRKPKGKSRFGPEVFIEKSAYAIDQPGERAGITLKGIAASRALAIRKRTGSLALKAKPVLRKELRRRW